MSKSSRPKLDSSTPEISFLDLMGLSLVGLLLSLLVLKLMIPLLFDMWVHKNHSSWVKTEGTLSSLVIVPNTSRTGFRSYEPQVSYRFFVASKEFVGKTFSSRPFRHHDTQILSKSVEGAVPGLRGFWEQAYQWDTNTLKLSGLPQKISVFYYPSDPSYSMIASSGLIAYGLMDWFIFGALFILTIFLSLIALILDLFAMTGWFTQFIPYPSSSIEGKSIQLRTEKERYARVLESGLKPSINADSNDWAAYAEGLMLKERYQEALVALDIAESKSPVEYGTCLDDLEIILHRTECLLRLGKVEGAYQTFRELELFRSSPVFEELGDRVDKLRVEIDKKRTPPNQSKPLFEFEENQ